MRAMRILLCVAVFAAACGGAKQKTPQAPAATEAEHAPGDEDLRDQHTPDDPDDPVPDTAADPCGGE